MHAWAAKTGVIKLQSFLVRRDEMTHEAFRDYWLTEHVPIARELPGLRCYRTAVPVDSDRSRYDGIAELYFDSVAAFEAVLGPDNDTEAMRDVPNFERTSDRCLVIETVHRDDLGDRTRAPKLVAIVHRSPELSREGFHERWIDALRPGSVPSLRKVTTAVPVEPDEADYDGVVEFYADDVDALKAAVRGPDGDLTFPIDDGLVGRVDGHLVEEIVQVAFNA
jgi:uncharacterized protein (TIGR02118 family)